MKKSCQLLGTIMGALVLAGCQSSTYMSVNQDALGIAKSWKNELNTELSSENSNKINDALLSDIISQGLTSNFQLKSKFYLVETQRLALAISDSQLYPLINLSAGQSRREVSPSTYTDSANIDVNLSYELDIWGKLSAASQRDAYNYAAEKSSYENQKLELISTLSRTWYKHTEASLLVRLYEQRLENLRQNQDVIDRSYKLGLSGALDVYLSQNNLFQEASRLSQQRQNLLNISHELNLLLGRDPNTVIDAATSFPTVELPSDFGVPAELLTRRHDIQTKWLNLLALDKSVAVAHKQRFPKLSLTASSGVGGDSFSTIKDNTDILWSIAANLAGPIFDAGRLKAQEEQAKLRLLQSEQDYRYAVWDAISEVELLFAEHSTLSIRKSALQKSEQNAVAAEKLAFNQYQKGLVNYNTVLESQRRAFDAKTSLIQINSQIIQNRIAIYVALGGDYQEFVVNGSSES